MPGPLADRPDIGPRFDARQGRPRSALSPLMLVKVLTKPVAYGLGMEPIVHEGKAPAQVRFENALAAICEFHRLRERRRSGATLSLGEARTLYLVRELLEPRRVVAHGMRRSPVRLLVHRAGLLSARGTERHVQVLALSLHEVEVASERAPNLGADVRLAVAGPTRGAWFRFRGRVARLLPRGRVAVRLIAPAGTPAPRTVRQVR